MPRRYRPQGATVSALHVRERHRCLQLSERRLLPVASSVFLAITNEQNNAIVKLEGRLRAELVQTVDQDRIRTHTLA